MNYIVVPIILHLLLTTPSLQYREVELLNRLNNFFDFDHNILLLDSSIDHNRYIATSTDRRAGNYTPQSVYSFKFAADGITGLEGFKEIKSKNTFLVVVTESPEKFESDEPLLNVFTYNPFGTFDIINVTSGELLSNYFPQRLSNFRKHPIRLPRDQISIIDYDDKLWKIVLDILNASISIVQLNETLMSPSQLVDDNIVDIVPLLHVLDELRNVYPMRMDTMVIVVPQALPFSNFMAYLRRITSGHLTGYSFITIVSVTVLLTVFGYLKRKKIVFFQCLADVLNLLMNDNAAIKYQKLNRVDVCIIVPLTFVGFVVVNGVLSIFQSYLTLPVIQPQINSIEDLYRSPFPILAPNDFWASKVTELLEHVSKHAGWNDKVISTDLQEINQQIFVFNTSISFPSFKSEAKILLEIQKRLDIRGYHVPTETYLVQSMQSYSVNDNFPFIERLNDIIYTLREAGLFDKWLEEHNEKTVKSLLSKNRGSQTETSNSSGVGGFPVPAIIIYGWIVSVIIFIWEIIWEKFKLARLITRLFKRETVRLQEWKSRPFLY